jgi:putative endonuclease
MEIGNVGVSDFCLPLSAGLILAQNDLRCESILIYYIYIVQCADGTLYTGCANDLERRIEKHNLGRGAKYTRGRSPVKLVYFEQFKSQTKALQREYEIKQLNRAEKIALINLQKED